MEFRWSKRWDHCVNCLTQDRRHAARGYCSKCYEVLRRMERAREWEHDVTRIPTHFPLVDVPKDPEEFTRVKLGVIKQLQAHLDRLAVRRRMVADRTVEGINIEFLLRDIAVRAGAKESSVGTYVANLMNHEFTVEQKATLYELLLEIDEDIRRPMVDVMRLLMDSDG